MKTLNTECIILGHKNFAETDKIIYLYSKELGKIRAFARGARKINSKFSGHLETMNFCNCSLYFGAKKIIITEIVTIKNFKTLREDFEKSKNTLKIAEITNKLIYENQQIEEFCDFLENILEYLSKSQNPQLITYSYLIKMLDFLGLIPDFKEINSKIEKKYLKFLHYLKTQSLKNIEKIELNLDEKEKVSKIFEQLLIYAT